MEERAVKRGLARRRLSRLRAWEWTKNRLPAGHRYFTIVNDLSRSRERESRDAEPGPVLDIAHTEQLQSVEAVAMDNVGPLYIVTGRNLSFLNGSISSH